MNLSEATAQKARRQYASVFLTYSQCPIAKDVMLELLQALPYHIKDYVIAQEHHLDGNLHLHIGLWFVTKFRSRLTSIFDITYEDKVYHPHIHKKPCSSPLNVLKYCTKEDSSPLTNMDLKLQIAAREQHRTILGKRLTSGQSTIQQEYEQDNIPLLMIPKYRAALKAYKEISFKPKRLCKGFTFWNRGFPIYDGSEKHRHFWFYSLKPNTGKTTLLEKLNAKYECVYWNHSEQFQKVTPYTQFIFMDEYSVAKLKVTDLNSICSGSFMIPIKG